MSDYDFDVFIIGGGINGCGIARDAVGRGYRVGLAEMNDLASATSSASTKLFHGGLRYLEYFEFRLVKEALIEREHLLHAMPHISWPMRFVLPIAPDMRFDNSTPTSRLLQKIMPWMKGRRPDWLIRLGLFLYDHMGGREVLPETKTLNLRRAEEGRALKNSFNKAFEYSDCWIEDSRLVTLNAQDAKQRGATIMTRTKVVATSRKVDHWIITLLDQQTQVRHEITTKMIVNAAGPWVGELLGQTLGLKTNEGVRLVRGSHIVTRKLYDHNKAWTQDEINYQGDVYNFQGLTTGPAKPYQTGGPLLYFGGYSPAALELCGQHCDVYLMWPEPKEQIAERMKAVNAVAERYNRTLDYGLRVHVIVRDTEAEAKEYADYIVSKLDDEHGRKIRERALDSTSLGVSHQAKNRDIADEFGYVEPHLWTGVGRARSGCGAAIVGSADQVLNELEAYQKMGIRAFILSGYPHIDECKHFGTKVLPNMKTCSLPHAYGRVPSETPMTPLGAGVRK